MTKHTHKWKHVHPDIDWCSICGTLISNINDKYIYQKPTHKEPTPKYKYEYMCSRAKNEACKGFCATGYCTNSEPHIYTKGMCNKEFFCDVMGKKCKCVRIRVPKEN